MMRWTITLSKLPPNNMTPEKIREWSERIREIEGGQTKRNRQLRTWFVGLVVAVGALLLADLLFLVAALINSAR